MDTLTPSDLFSPSKARQQRAQAQDWAHIDTWLQYKYSGRTIPTFERNDETLKVLRELSIANERADEERAVQERLEREALKELDKSTRHTHDAEILAQLSSALTPTGSTALDALSSTTVALSLPTPSPESIAHALIHHTSVAQTLTNHLSHIQTLQSYLEKQHSLLQEQLQTLQNDAALATPPTLQRQTVDQARQTKHLRAKIRDYEDKLSSLQNTQQRTRSGSSITAATPRSADASSASAIAAMLEQQQRLDELRVKVEGLEREVSLYAGLPADREAARKEVGRLEVEMDGLRRARDGLFEGLVG